MESEGNPVQSCFARRAVLGFLVLTVLAAATLGGSLFVDGFNGTQFDLHVTRDSKLARRDHLDRPANGIRRSVEIELISIPVEPLERSPVGRAALLPGATPGFGNGLSFRLDDGELELDLLRASIVYDLTDDFSSNLSNRMWVRIPAAGFGGPVFGAVTFGKTPADFRSFVLESSPSSGTPFDRVFHQDFDFGSTNNPNFPRIQFDFLLNPGSPAGLDLLGLRLGSGAAPPPGGAGSSVPVPLAAWGGTLLLGLIAVVRLRRTR